jgi:hypothetical protein
MLASFYALRFYCFFFFILDRFPFSLFQDYFLGFLMELGVMNLNIIYDVAHWYQKPKNIHFASRHDFMHLHETLLCITLGQIQ